MSKNRFKKIVLSEEKSNSSHSVVSMRSLKGVKPKYYDTCIKALESNKTYEEFIPSTIDKLFLTKKFRFWMALNKATNTCFHMTPWQAFDLKEKGKFPEFNLEEMIARKLFLEKLLKDDDDIDEAKIIVNENEIATFILYCRNDGELSINVPVRRSLVIAGVVGLTSLFSLPMVSFAVESTDTIPGDEPKVEENINPEDPSNPSGPSNPSDPSDPEEPEEPELNPYYICKIAGLTSTQKSQTITAYNGKKPTLPSTLKATVETGDVVSVKVKWTPNKTYNNKIAGTYTYKASLTDSKYTLASKITLPKITVKVVKADTKITGVSMTPSWTSRKTATDTIKVYNGYGRTLKLQMYSSGKWVTKKSITLKNSSSQEVKVTYPNSWWKVTSSKWRLYVASNDGINSYKTDTIKFTTKRYYQNPSKYIQIQDKITIDNSGAYTLKYGYMGLKTRQVNKYFGIGDKYWPRYTSTTQSKVKAFQKKKGLKVTGNVDKATWLKMGYSEDYWNNAGAYVSPIKVNPYSSKSDHIEAMIDRAYDYLGSDYVVGASGKPSQGADCSGLVMQCLYAAGIEMPGINPATHSKAGHEYESRNIWERGVFPKVSYSNKKRGDLIFYCGSSGVVNHVAIYLGNGKVIESWPNKVRVAPVNHHQIKGVMRVFN